MKFAFRADASIQIGSGHVMRCLTLAGALAEAGNEIRFLCREHEGNLCGLIERRGFAVTRLPGTKTAGGSGETSTDVRLDGSWEQDADEAGRAIGDYGDADWLIVDHYGLDARWETRLRRHARHIMAIDDLADRPHDCDLLLDQNRMFDGKSAYAGLVPDGAELLVGPKFALLRPDFARLHAAGRGSRANVRRVNICFGGADPAGHTLSALKALLGQSRSIERIDVVVGPQNPHRAKIEKAVAGSPNVKVHLNPADLPSLLQMADLAIGGGGTMSWERACLGVPALAIGIVPNQFQNIADLNRAGMAIGPVRMEHPDEQLFAHYLDILLDNHDLLAGMSERCRAVVDGRGVERVVKKLLRAELHFRRAGPDDVERTFAWRNHPAIRAVSGNQGELEPEAHRRWFKRVISDPQRIMLIAEVAGRPVGVTRFDIDHTVATISVYKDPEYPGPLDLVGQSSRWLLENRQDVSEIRATVLADNEASRRAFETSGYVLAERHYRLRRTISNTGRKDAP